MDFVPAHPRDVEFQATPILSRPMSPRANNDVESTMTSAEKSMTAAPDAPHAGAEAALHHQAPPSKVLIPVLVLAAFGLYLASLAPQIVTLAVRIAGVDPDGKTIGLSAVLLAGAVVSIASLPVFGALSDRTRGRFGRRVLRPGGSHGPILVARVDGCTARPPACDERGAAMEFVHLVDVDDLSPELRAMWDATPRAGLKQFVQVMANAERYHVQFSALYASVRFDNHLGNKLSELVRLTVANTTECPVCMAGRLPAAVEEGMSEDLVCQLTDIDQGDFTDAERAAIRFAHKQKLPIFVLGSGSNLVVPDEGFPGLVLHSVKAVIVAVEKAEALAAAGITRHSARIVIDKCDIPRLRQLI